MHRNPEHASVRMKLALRTPPSAQLPLHSSGIAVHREDSRSGGSERPMIFPLIDSVGLNPTLHESTQAIINK